MMYLTKENNPYNWHFPDCPITISYHLFRCIVISTGEPFYSIAGFSISYNKFDEKCAGIDSLLSSNSLNFLLLMKLCIDSLALQLYNERHIDCNEEQNLNILPFWRDCYAIADCLEDNIIKKEMILCEGEAQCCLIIKYCWNSQTNQLEKKIINVPSPNVFCSKTPISVPSNAINISECQRLCDIMEILLKN